MSSREERQKEQLRRDAEQGAIAERAANMPGGGVGQPGAGRPEGPTWADTPAGRELRKQYEQSGVVFDSGGNVIYNPADLGAAEIERARAAEGLPPSSRISGEPAPEYAAKVYEQSRRTQRAYRTSGQKLDTLRAEKQAAIADAKKKIAEASAERDRLRGLVDTGKIDPSSAGLSGLDQTIRANEMMISNYQTQITSIDSARMDVAKQERMAQVESTKAAYSIMGSRTTSGPIDTARISNTSPYQAPPSAEPTRTRPTALTGVKDKLFANPTFIQDAENYTRQPSFLGDVRKERPKIQQGVESKLFINPTYVTKQEQREIDKTKRSAFGISLTETIGTERGPQSFAISLNEGAPSKPRELTQEQVNNLTPQQYVVYRAEIDAYNKAVEQYNTQQKELFKAAKEQNVLQWKQSKSELLFDIAELKRKGVTVISAQTTEGPKDIPINNAFKALSSGKIGGATITGLGIAPNIQGGFTIAGSLSEPILVEEPKRVVSSDPFPTKPQTIQDKVMVLFKLPKFEKESKSGEAVPFDPTVLIPIGAGAKFLTGVGKTIISNLARPLIKEETKLATTKLIKPANMFREPIPKDVFAKDTARTLDIQQIPLGRALIQKLGQPKQITPQVKPIKQDSFYKPELPKVRAEKVGTYRIEQSKVFESDRSLAGITSERVELGTATTKIIPPKSEFMKQQLALGEGQATQVTRVSLGKGLVKTPTKEKIIPDYTVKQDSFYKPELPKVRAEKVGTYRIEQSKVFESDRSLAGITSQRVSLGKGITRQPKFGIPFTKQGISLGRSDVKLIDYKSGFEKTKINLGTAQTKVPDLQKGSNIKPISEDPLYKPELPKVRAEKVGTYRIEQSKVFESDRSLAGITSQRVKIGSGIGKISGKLGWSRIGLGKAEGFFISKGAKSTTPFRKPATEQGGKASQRTILEKPVESKGFTSTKIELGKSEKTGVVIAGATATPTLAPTVGIGAGTAIAETINQTGTNQTEQIPDEIDIPTSAVIQEQSTKPSTQQIGAITRGSSYNVYPPATRNRLRIDSVSKSRTASGLKTSSSLIQPQKEKTASRQISTPLTSTRQVQPFRTRQAQRQRFSQPFPSPQSPALATGPIFAQQPWQRQLLRARPPQPKRLTPLGINIPNRKEKKKKRAKEEEKGLATFIGNVRITEVEGIYGKRSEITYGEKRTAKLALSDVRFSSKGSLVSGKRKGMLKAPKQYFTPTARQSKNFLKL